MVMGEQEREVKRRATLVNSVSAAVSHFETKGTVQRIHVKEKTTNRVIFG